MAKKTSARRRPARTVDKRAKPVRRPRLRKELGDNPRGRYQELIKDRHFGMPPHANLAQARHAALAQVRAPTPTVTPTMPVTPGGNNWIQLGPLAIPKGRTCGGAARVIVTGRVTDIVPHPTDPQTVYVASARGGIWKTTDGGVTWAPMSDHADSLQIGALGIAHSSPQTLYAGTGEGNVYFYAVNYPLKSINVSYGGSGILKSTDGGATWTTQAAKIFTGNCFYRIRVHPTDPNTAIAASNVGLYRTTDGGANWKRLTNGLPPIGASVIAATDIVFDPITPRTAYTAFWGSGIYKTTNATASNPSWTKLTRGLPARGISRIAIAVSPISPQSVYALIANGSDGFKGFYVSSDGGTSWTSVAAPVVQVYGSYTLNVAVDIATPDVVYLSGVSLYKAARTAGTWTVTEVGANIHADNHAFGSHPTDHRTIYAGTDGGIYKSSDGGATWDDTVNEGICITQFEFIDQHPTSDAIVIGGTQDNGTNQFRNSPAFYHSADRDGGSAGIDQSRPRNVIHTYSGASPNRSTQGGNFGTYAPITRGLTGQALFYPPLAYDQTNSQNIAFGTTVVNLDAAQGTGGWRTKVALPRITGRVSAISYVNPSLLYAGTTEGEVYRLVKTGATWTATAIQSAPLPSRWIWGLTTAIGNADRVLVAMAGFGTPHIWQGALSGGSATWSDISGTSPNCVPDVPCNALCVDPAGPSTYYLGTDVGVFRTTDGGANWAPFSEGLPNTAVYDLKLHAPTRLLRAATHGRGLWERKLDVSTPPDVDLFLRDHIMDTARRLPTPLPVIATYDEPLQNVSLGDQLWWWMCADAKVDSPAPTTHTYQMPVAAVDYLAFETLLAHRDPQRNVANRIYVQVHNRGIQAATNVTVKILYADATPRLPDLPPDFWTAFPGNGTTTFWKPIGAAKTIATISPTRPEILEWDWILQAGAAQHSCLLIVTNCANDPIPPAHKVFDIATLVTQEKGVGLKNLHMIDALAAPYWSKIHISAGIKAADVLRLVPPPKDWGAGFIVPSALQKQLKATGIKSVAMTNRMLEALRKTIGAADAKLYDLKNVQVIDPSARFATLTNFLKTKGFDLLLVFSPQKGAAQRTFTLIQESAQGVVGGNTFILRPK